MKIKHVFLVSALVFALVAQAQESRLKSYVVGFYNLENLYDTIDDPIVNDAEYLPEGSNKWGTMKYINKLEKMSYAISKFPDHLAFLGVSEIENRRVLEDLVAQPSIKDKNYQIVHYDGPDRRGVDVALLYNPELFRVISSKSYRVQSEIEDFITRDQLLVTGVMGNDTVSVIVLHWPSRGGGEKRSMPRRRDAALTTKHICDSILARNPMAKVVVMGDLNDDPRDASLMVHLGARPSMEETKTGELFNPYYALHKKGIGSLGYNDQWNLFDQIIVSYGFLGTDYSNLKFVKAEVFNKDFLKEFEGKYKGYPKRTHAGGVWKNGYSDHFPSFVWLVEKK